MAFAVEATCDKILLSHTDSPSNVRVEDSWGPPASLLAHLPASHVQPVACDWAGLWPLCPKEDVTFGLETWDLGTSCWSSEAFRRAFLVMCVRNPYPLALYATKELLFEAEAILVPAGNVGGTGGRFPQPMEQNT